MDIHSFISIFCEKEITSFLVFYKIQISRKGGYIKSALIQSINAMKLKRRNAKKEEKHVKKFKKVLSLVLAMAMILPLFPTPEVYAEEANSQFSVSKSGTGTGTIMVNDSDIGESFNQTYNIGETIKVNAKASEGSIIDYVKVINGEKEENISYDEMSEYSKTFTANADDMKVEVSFIKKKTEQKGETANSQNGLQEENAVPNSKSENEKTEEPVEETTKKYTDRSEVIGTATVVSKEDLENKDGGVALFSAQGSIATITPGKNHSYGSWGTCEFDVRTQTGNHLGFCAEPNSGTPSGNFQVSILDDSIEKNANIKAAILCYVIPELYEALGKNIYNEKDNNTYAYCHALIGYLYNGSLTGLSASMANGVKMMRDAVNYQRQTNPTLISYMQKYKVYIAYNNLQDIVWVEKNEKGGLSISKKSADSTLTDANANYSLAGAEYGIYTDSNCTNKVKTITTDASGYAATLDDELDFGTYYVKEIKPSKGYELDTKVYTCTISSSGSASINRVVSKEPPKSGKIKLEKTSAKPDVTDGNDNYSLAGAEYSVYRNSACTDFVDKIVTDDKGKGSLDNLPLGTYYVKETKASQGYGLDTKVYTVDITSGDTAVIEKTVTSKEIPNLDPTYLLLKKVDSETGEGTPQGNASLADAQFRVKYYPVIMDTDPAKSGHTPTKTWVLKTDEDGFLALDDAYKVSGDDFFYSPTGSVGLPYGTLTFEEIKAPEGYLLNPTIIVSKIASTSSSNIVYNEPIQKENVLKMDIEKIQAGTSKPIKGVVFEHTKPDGSKETLTTDENGQLSFKGLQWGNHTVKEISAPDGYSLNTNKITFTVGTDNKITITSKGTETDTNGNIKITVTKDGNISAVVEDKPAPYDLLIHKVNEKDKVLEGAEFTLYSDAECKQEIAKAVSKSDGTLRFDDLIVGKTYYLKETKAPEGYRIPVNPDGSDIVYTIKAESVPVDNLFKVIINGKEYDSSSTGAFKVTGTKADRVVDMTITNHTTKKLPETGSYWMIPILIIGAGLMIYGMRKAKNPHGDDEDKTMDTKKEE